MVDCMEIKIIDKEANYEDSLRILKDANLEPLTYQEAFMNRKELIKVFKGELKWFWISGKGLDKFGCHTIDKDGNVFAGRGEVDDTVYLWKGDISLSLGVHSDDYASQGGGRFALYADNVPSDVAPVVVGRAKQRAEIVDSLLRKIDETVDVLGVQITTLEQFLRPT